LAADTADQTSSFELDEHLVDRGWCDLEEPLEIGFGGTSAGLHDRMADALPTVEAQAALFDELASLIERRGVEPFVAAPLLEADDRFFPDGRSRGWTMRCSWSRRWRTRSRARTGGSMSSTTRRRTPRPTWSA